MNRRRTVWGVEDGCAADDNSGGSSAALRQTASGDGRRSKGCTMPRLLRRARLHRCVALLRGHRHRLDALQFFQLLHPPRVASLAEGRGEEDANDLPNLALVEQVGAEAEDIAVIVLARQPCG